MPKWKKQTDKTLRVNTPMPLVDAIAPRTNSWTVRDSTDGFAYTDPIQGIMGVPLNDEPCKYKSCKGYSHNPAIRIHEMLHARFSPAKLTPIAITAEQYTSLEKLYLNGALGNLSYSILQLANEITIGPLPPTKPNDIIIYPEIMVAAEETLINYIQIYKMTKTPNRKQMICPIILKTEILEAITQPKAKLIDILTLAATVINLDINPIKKLAYSKVPIKYKNKTDLIQETTRWLLELRYRLNRITSQPQWVIEVNRGNWQLIRKAIAILYAIAVGIEEAKLKERNTPKKPEFIVEEDLKDMEKYIKSRGIDDRAFDEALKSAYEGKENKEVEWGDMIINTPPLIKKLSSWKTQRLNRPIAEGSIPTYMHRYAVDMNVFRRTKHTDGVSILIDASGSMQYTIQDINQILEICPGSIIAMYSGKGSTGELRILANNGKRINQEIYLRPYGTGNDIDLPALKWLGQQIEPRIWISDGQVVAGKSRTFGLGAVTECIAACKTHQINKVNNAKEALEILQGKRLLQR